MRFFTDDLCTNYKALGREFKCHHAWRGTPLAQVLSIIIDTKDTEEECEYYGTIEFTDCNGSSVMYEVVKEDPVSFTKTKTVVLWQQQRAICAEDGFTVFFDLKDIKNGDVELVKGSFSWALNDARETCIVADVTGLYGSTARVEYVVFDVSVEANIWAKFFRDQNDCVLHLKGTIVARYKHMYGDKDLVRDTTNPSKHFEILLFDDELTELVDDDIISLERPILVLPVDCTISMYVDLIVTDSNGISTTLIGELQYSPNADRSCYYQALGGECGAVKFDLKIWYYDFSYVLSLYSVETRKKELRERGILLNSYLGCLD